MRRIATALLALAALSLAAPLGALRPGQDAARPRTQLRPRRMKEAPAAVQKAGIACAVTDAAYVGASNGKDGAQNVYEVACQQGMGLRRAHRQDDQGL